MAEIKEKMTQQKESNNQKEKKNKVNISLNLVDMLDLFKMIVVSRIGIKKALETKIKHKLDLEVKKGKLTEEEAAETLTDLNKKLEKSLEALNEKIDAGIEKTMKTLHVATTSDLKELEDKVDRLLKQLNELTSKSRPATRKTTRKTSSKTTASSAPKKNAQKKSGK